MISNLTALPVSTVEANVVGGPLSYEVLGDKFEYWQDDNSGLFYAYLPAATYSNQYAIIKLKGHDLVTLDSLSTAYSTSTNRFSFEIDLSELEEDDYIISVSLLNFDHEMAGGVALGGSAIVRSTRHYVASGGITLSGAAVINFTQPTHLYYTASGGIILGNTATVRFIKKYYHFIANASITLGGRARYRIIEDTPNEPPIIVELITNDNLYYIKGGYVAAITPLEIPPDQVPSDIMIITVESEPVEPVWVYDQGGIVPLPDADKVDLNDINLPQLS